RPHHRHEERRRGRGRPGRRDHERRDPHPGVRHPGPGHRRADGTARGLLLSPGAGASARPGPAGPQAVLVAGSAPPRPSGRSRASIAATSSDVSVTSTEVRFSTIREGVTDFGMVTMPWARCQASTTWAGLALWASATEVTAGFSSRSDLPWPSGP